MKDKSKRLTVVNTEKKPSEKKEVQQVIVQPSSSSSSHAPGFNPNLYLLKSVWDSVFEIKTDVSGQKYIFGKLPVVTKYGITMYADDGNVEIPQLAEGLPFDQRTIWFNPETKQIEVIGGTGGGEGGVSNFWDLSGIPSWITNSKPIYNYSEINGTPDLSVFVTGTALSNTLADYATLSYLTSELKKYVTLDGAQDIKGVKNFVNGLKVGGLPITKKKDDVVYLDANLVVRGGITMYAESEVDIPSILDSLPIASTSALGIAKFDSTYFSVDSNGMVTLTSAPSSGASYLGKLDNVDDSIDATASVDRVLYQPAGSAMWTWRELPKDGVVGDYLPLSGGTINGNSGLDLIINTSYSEYNLIGFKQNNTYRGYVGVEADGKIGLYSYVSRSFFGINSSGEPYVQNDKINQIYNILHAGNYSTYALPLSGGTIIGDLATSNGTRLFLNKGGDGIYIYNEGISFHNSSNNWVASNMGFYSDGSVLLCPIGGNVGIGTTSPSEKLDVVGYVKSSDGYHLANTTDSYCGLVAARRVSNGGDARDIWLYNNHMITIYGGTGVTVATDLLVSGGITMYSDIRKKTKLQDVELSLSQIANAPLIEHYYNSDQNKTTHVGSIAQYWAQINDWFCKLDNEGYYTMEIQNCALASAISIARHLEKYESKTDKTIRKMKQRIQELEDEVERLKQN